MTAANRYRRRHARRLASFSQGAARGRAAHRAEVRWRQIQPHEDEWMRVAERNRAGVVCLAAVQSARASQREV